MLLFHVCVSTLKHAMPMQPLQLRSIAQPVHAGSLRMLKHARLASSWPEQARVWTVEHMWACTSSNCLVLSS